jgi:UDP-glucose 4-epimerase
MRTSEVIRGRIPAILPIRYRMTAAAAPRAAIPPAGRPIDCTAMRVLVTGGAGFIGSHLTDALLARGDEVAVVDDLSAGRAGRLHEDAALHKLSITAAGPLDAVITDLRPELVCHLAAQIDVRASVAAPAADARANVVGTVNVLEAARAAGARVLFCSTGGALYGTDAPIPATEDVLPLPESPYGIAKQCAEQYVGLYNRLHRTAHAVLRLSNVYGPRQDPGGESGVIPIFCSRILAGERPTIFGDGQQTRDYVYVRDAVAAFLAVTDRGRPGTWNIGSGREVSVLELARVIAAAAGRPVEPLLAPARPGELLRSALAVRRAERDLGWRPVTPLAAGVTAVLRWIEAGAGDRAAC